MGAKHTIPTDPVALVRQLDAGAIRQRIDAIDRERKALLVLLRAAQRAERDSPRQPVTATEEGRRDE
jgi:hypothetical protein